MIIFQVVLFVLTGLAVIMYYAAAAYKKKKKAEYGNDERWKAIVAAAMKIVYRYHTVLLVLVLIGIFVGRITEFDLQFSFVDVLGILSVVLLGVSAVELFSLYIFDKRM